jgi:hypothetical protein
MERIWDWGNYIFENLAKSRWAFHHYLKKWRLGIFADFIGVLSLWH